MDFLTKELIKVNGISIALWHVIVAVTAVVLLVIIIVAICRGGRKAKSAKTSPQTNTPTQEPTTEPVVVTDTDADLTDPAVVVDDSNAVTADPAIVVVDDPDQEPSDQAIVVVEDPVDQPTESPAETPAPATPKKPTVKNYHISLRPDGKWQVKLSKGGKASKLFNTQAEAIAFAKARAKSQDGHITIHKVDGKIRKQKY